MYINSSHDALINEFCTMDIYRSVYFCFATDATNKACKCHMICFYQWNSVYWERPWGHSVSVDSAAARVIESNTNFYLSLSCQIKMHSINTSTCRRVFLCMKKLLKYEMKINTVGFPPVVSFTFLWAIKCFLCTTIINMSEDQDTVRDTYY